MTGAIDPELLALIPEPFISVKPGDQVTLFVDRLDRTYTNDPTMQLQDALNEWCPKVTWAIVEGVGVTGVIHVSREDRTPQP